MKNHNDKKKSYLNEKTFLKLFLKIFIQVFLVVQSFTKYISWLTDPELAESNYDRKFCAFI